MYIEPLTSKAALVIVDLQRDFLPGGSLAVSNGDRILPVINDYIRLLRAHGLPVFATRDWHPIDHCSFQAQGGIWPRHCIAHTPGAQFPPEMMLPPDVRIISKATDRDKDAYSGFEGTDLDAQLRAQQVERLYIGGLATDYCVLNTVKDALRNGYQVRLLLDAIGAVNLRPDDGNNSVEEMVRLGAKPIRFSELPKSTVDTSV